MVSADAGAGATADGVAVAEEEPSATVGATGASVAVCNERFIVCCTTRIRFEGNAAARGFVVVVIVFRVWFRM